MCCVISSSSASSIVISSFVQMVKGMIGIIKDVCEVLREKWFTGLGCKHGHWWWGIKPSVIMLAMTLTTNALRTCHSQIVLVFLTCSLSLCFAVSSIVIYIISSFVSYFIIISYRIFVYSITWHQMPRLLFVRYRVLIYIAQILQVLIAGLRCSHAFCTTVSSKGSVLLIFVCPTKCAIVQL